MEEKTEKIIKEHVSRDNRELWHYGPEQLDFQALIFHCPSSLGVSEHFKQKKMSAVECSEQCRERELVSGARDQAIRQANGPVLTCGLLIVLDHSGLASFASL